MLKPPLVFLHRFGHLSVVYADDSFYWEEHILNGFKIFNIQFSYFRCLDLPYILKNVLISTKKLGFSGYSTNTINMTITLKPRKKNKNQESANLH